MIVVVEVLAGIVFFGLIILSVLLHECGHFIPAKIFGVKVTEFFAGFGPKIWSFTRGETEYGFKWIPLGLSLIHISEPTDLSTSRMPSSA